MENKPDYTYESRVCARGYARPAGVDEAGVGPLAGPVYAAAVMLPPDCVIPGLNDSKQLTHNKRAALVPLIQSVAVAWAVAFATVDEIGTLNIKQAAQLAMRRAVAELDPPADYLLIDGNYAVGFTVPHEKIVGGDALSVSIAAASVLAKEARDSTMLELHEQYPQYGFDRHKGYPTKAHYAALAAYGPSPVHRKGFRLL